MKTIKYITAFLIPLLVTYSIFAFALWNLNPRYWSEDNRGLAIIFAYLLSAVAGVLTFLKEND